MNRTTAHSPSASMDSVGRPMPWLSSGMVLLTLYLCLIPARSVFAQATAGTILGVVTDPSGAVIPGAKVIITNTGTNLSNSFVTDARGSYVVPYLIPGTYSISARKEGFKEVTKTGIVLQVGQKARVDLTLEVGAVTQSVTVSTLSPMLQTESSEESQVITAHTIVSMPLNYRSFVPLLYLNTGAIPNHSATASETNSDNPQGASATNINGLPPEGNSWQLDGASNNETYFQMLTVNPSVDAIQEFKVSNNNYSAEYGGASGAIVQIVTKSGTNHFHGDAFEFLRNKSLDANDFFSNSVGSPIPPYRRNEFGGTLGGPIQKDRMFFFADYQGQRSTTGQTSMLTVPTPLQREGVFTEVDPISGAAQPTIYNPFTHQPFLNNTIPQNMINQASANVDKLVPLPNLKAPNGQPLLASNYFGQSNEVHNTNDFDARVDRRFSDNDQFFVRYSLLSTMLNNPPYLGPVAGGMWPWLNALAHTRNQNVVISETHTINPQSLNEFRFAVNRVRTDWGSPFMSQNTSDQVGIPGINNVCGYCGGLPAIGISGLDTIGHSPYSPAIRHETVFQWVDNVTLIRGKHTIKFGADITRDRTNRLQSPNPVGEFDFNQQNTSNDGAPNTGIGEAGFLLGYPYAESRVLPITFPSLRQSYFAFYGQDDFRVSNRLTLNLGLRWEYTPPLTDAWGNMANFDLATGDVLIPPAISPTGGINPDLRDWGPRVGFAYSFGKSRKTVLRGGFGTSYDWPRGDFTMQLDGMFPYVQSQAFYSANPFTVTPGDPILSQGLPYPSAPEARPGAPLGHLVPPGGILWEDPNVKAERINQWSLDLQRELAPNLMLDVGYVGNLAIHLPISKTTNYPEPGQDLINPVTGQPNTLQERRPYYAEDPLLGTFASNFNGARSHYNALQVKLEKRTSYGLSFLGSYTWSHDLGVGTEYNNPSNYMGNEDNQYFNPAQNFVFSYVYELPFGRGKTFGSGWNRWVNGTLGGWEASGITSFSTGFPFTPAISSTLDNGNGNQPNRICDGSVSNPTIQRWYNPSCFVSPPLNVFGNSGYNILYGPHYLDWDIGVMKNFHFSESRYLQFRSEFFNTFNQVNFGLPNTFECGGTCGEGTITGLAGNYNPRLIQFALKLYF